MPDLTCPSNFTLMNGTCYGQCPPNYIVLNTDTTMCVSHVTCPQDTIEVDGMTCQKSHENAVNGTCTQGAQYSPGICYYPSPCPAPFLESGFNCLKKTIARTEFQPLCANFLLGYQDGECNTLSIYGKMLILFILVIVAIWTYQSGFLKQPIKRNNLLQVRTT
jgi:hypothetical protein